MVKMSVNRFCGDCMELGEFLPLKLVMMNINSGIWMCPKDECAFPMTSPCLQDYMEENLNSDRVMLLSGKSVSNTFDKLQNSSKGLYKEKVDKLHTDTGQSAGSVKSDKSKTISENKFFTKTCTEDNSSTISEMTGTRSHCSTTDLAPLPSGKDIKGLPLWENQELLCWLDSIMSLLVLCETLQQHKKENGVLQRFYQQFNDLASLYRSTDKYQSVKGDLEILRTCTLKFLHQKMMSNFTDEDSPLLSIQLLLKTSKTLYENLEWEYATQFTCTECQFERTDSFRKMILDLPEPHPDLNFTNNLYYARNCYRCSAPNQKTIYNVQRFPQALFLYCENGVGDRRFWKNLNFTAQTGDHFIVTQIVQYSAKRKHFVLWSFAYKEKLWIEVDDLKEPIVRPQYARPKCKLQDVHLIVLEKVSTLENAVSRFKLCDSENNTVENSSTPSPASDAVSDSSTLSGNSSVAVMVSGDTSRKTSLCSADGISPSGSVRNLFGKATCSSNDLRETLKDNEGPKQRSLHVPRYSPYLPRSKKLKESQSPSPATSSTSPGTVSVNKTESTSTIKTDHFSEIFGNEISEFFKDLMSQEQAIDDILSQSHSQHVTNNNDLNAANTRTDDAEASQEDIGDESKIHFDIIPTTTTDTTESIRISDDELEDILNGVY